MVSAVQKIYGGFGNQAFQISAGILICKKLNIKTLYIDLSSLYKYSTKREFTINKIFELNNIKIKVLKNNSIFLSFISNLRIPKFLNALNISLPSFAVGDNNFLNILNSNKRKFLFMPFLIIDGYFLKCNDQKSFNLVSQELINMKKFSDLNTLKNSTCIHIRGNDFIDHNDSREWIIEFYVKAINFLIKEYDIRNIDVITDDLKHAHYLIGRFTKVLNSKIKFEFNQDNNSFDDDIKRFSNYQYHILSDSTFSIIASSLCQNNLIKRFAPDSFENKYPRKFLLRNEINLF